MLNESSGRVVIQRDVTFNKADFGKTVENDTTRNEDTVVIETISEERNEAIQPEVAHQRPARQIRPPVRYGVDEYVDTASCSATDQACHTAYYASQIVEPTTMKEAMASDYATEWKEAADLEYESLISNKTWELVELPVGCTPIGCLRLSTPVMGEWRDLNAVWLQKDMHRNMA